MVQECVGACMAGQPLDECVVKQTLFQGWERGAVVQRLPAALKALGSTPEAQKQEQERRIDVPAGHGGICL